jgi:hypothetical protein
MDLKRWIRANWDRVAAWICVALGVLVLILGWHGVARSAYPAQQMPYIISGGIGGALLVAIGATLLISSDLRDEWQKLDRIETRLAESQRTPTEGGGEEHGQGSHSNGTASTADHHEGAGASREEQAGDLGDGSRRPVESRRSSKEG